MTPTIRTAAVAALALLASACAVAMQPKMRIQADRNPAADFASYRTYAWATMPEQDGQWPARDDRTAFDWDVRKLVDQQMARLGYQQAAYGASDLLIDYGIDRREKTMDDSYGSYAAYLAQGGRGSLGETWVGGYQEGTLLVEATDPRRRAVVWYGAASAVVNPSLRAQRLPQAIGQLFASFPARTAP
jgi:hypothetical protein